MSEKIVQLNEEVIKGQLKELVRGDVYKRQKMGTKISVTLHTKAWKYYKVRKTGTQANGCDTKYCQYDEAHRDYVYTQAWIDFLFSKFSDPDELSRVKNQK